MSSTEIESIITRVLGGDIDAYEAIVRTYQQEVWKTVAAMLLNAPKTEDLVQQTFISAYEHLHRYERGRDFGAWLKEIARNQVRQEIRRRAREDHRLEVYHTHLLEVYETPSGSTQEHQFEEALHECTQKLPPSSLKLVEEITPKPRGSDAVGWPLSRHNISRTRCNSVSVL